MTTVTVMQDAGPQPGKTRFFRRRKRVLALGVATVLTVSVIAVYVFSVTAQYSYMKRLVLPSYTKASYPFEFRQFFPFSLLCGLDAPCDDHSIAILVFTKPVTVRQAVQAVDQSLRKQGLDLQYKTIIIRDQSGRTESQIQPGERFVPSRYSYHYVYRVQKHVNRCPLLLLDSYEPLSEDELRTVPQPPFTLALVSLYCADSDSKLM